MKNPVSTLAFTAGVTALSCGGAQDRAADPSTVSGDEPGAPAETASHDAISDESDEPEPPFQAEVAAPTKVEQEDEEGECHASSAKLALAVNRDSLSLEQGRAQATMDGPLCRIVLTITRKDGLPPVEKTFRYAGPERELRWNPVPADQIEKLEIRGYAENGAYAGVKVVPWSVSIDHKEVEFDTDKALIRPSEVPSLEDSLAKIKKVLATVKDKGLGTITLFIAGHTDTRGSDDHNRNLSRQRAQAIATWFVKGGLCIPIASEGFGETVLKKKTADEVEAQENRRVDYILAVEPPMSRKGAKPAWKWISQGC
ncbi:OmpA family protein [Myxococcota bacterium]